MFGPVLGSQKNDPGAPNEERAQIAVAALGDAPEDGAAAGRHLPGHKAEPGGKVTPLAEGGTIADGRDHGTGDDRSDAGHRHEALAGIIRFGKRLDLSRDFVEALVEMTEVGTQLGDHPDHAR